MIGNLAFWELPLLLLFVALALSLLVGVPVLVVRTLRRPRRDQLGEIARLEARVARLEAQARR